MIMHIKAHLAQFQEHVAVQLDFKNAFCTLHRQTCLEVVSGLLGSQPPMVSGDLQYANSTCAFAAPWGWRSDSPPMMEFPKVTP